MRSTRNVSHKRCLAPEGPKRFKDSCLEDVESQIFPFCKRVQATLYLSLSVLHLFIMNHKFWRFIALSATEHIVLTLLVVWKLTCCHVFYYFAGFFVFWFFFLLFSLKFYLETTRCFATHIKIFLRLPLLSFCLFVACTWPYHCWTAISLLLEIKYYLSTIVSKYTKASKQATVKPKLISSLKYCSKAF